MNNSEKSVLIEVYNIKKLFKKDPKQELLVLNDINFTIQQGEIVALLGRSGCGKSTLLRIIAGLTKPNSGEVLYRGIPIHKPVKGIAMVFQHFALMPWLTVLQNVELGLEALGIPRKERRKRALEAIDMIGLDGFESAFPKELSGGMRQRVGIARALVVDPDVLLMDEPFSALDILTADNLRSDLIDLWTSKKKRTNSILLVTHNIEEAIFLADRAIVLDDTPSVVKGTLKIDIPHPRDYQSQEFRQLVDTVYSMITATAAEAKEPEVLDLGYRLPEASISELAGLMETIEELQTDDQPINLPALADEVSLEIDDLLSLTEVLDILNFAEEAEGDIRLTSAGKQFANASLLQQKNIFAKHLVQYIPLIKHIDEILHESSNYRISKKHILEDLEPYLSKDDSNRVLKTAIEWGRYAELFAYDDNSEELNLEDPK
jgi:NitT/TauT family transport system ATP-binding protein